MLRRLLVWAALAGLAAIVFQNYSDIRRYLQMRNM
jgi:hypothetical protein